jgi:hypothetical protein
MLGDIILNGHGLEGTIGIHPKIKTHWGHGLNFKHLGFII